MTPQERQLLAELAAVVSNLAPPDGQRRIARAMQALQDALQREEQRLEKICRAEAGGALSGSAG